MSDPAVLLVAQRFLALTKLATLMPARPLATLTAQPMQPAQPSSSPVPAAPPRTPGVLPPLASIFPQKPPTSGLKATGLPGMPGMPAKNVIDQVGGLDARGVVVNGNFGAGVGVPKGASVKKSGDDDVFASSPDSPTMRGWQWRSLQRAEPEHAESWTPRIFSSESTPLIEMLASPTRQGLLHALAGGAAGAAAGYYGAPAAGTPQLGTALAGGGLGALLSGVYGYGKRRRENDRITDALRRTPPGATVGDYEKLQQQDLLGKVGFPLSRYLETGPRLDKSAGRFSNLLAGLLRSAKPAGRELLQTGLGAGAGYGLTALEQGTGYADPNMSGPGRAGLTATNMALGAALANPRSRNYLLNKRTMAPVVGQPGLFAQTAASRFARPIALGGLSIAAPRIASTADAGASAIRGFNEAVTNNPSMVEDRVKQWTDPAHLADTVVVPRARALLNEQVNRVLTSPQVNDASRIFTHSVGTNLAGSLGGGLMGGAAGHFLGKALLPDDERASYASRRWHDRLRSVVAALGATGGGIGGVYLANKFAPPLQLSGGATA